MLLGPIPGVSIEVLLKINVQAVRHLFGHPVVDINIGVLARYAFPDRAEATRLDAGEDYESVTSWWEQQRSAVRGANVHVSAPANQA